VDRKERLADQETSLLTMMNGWQAEVNTAMPAIVESYDPSTNTCVLQPAIQYQVRDPEGNTSWVTLPLITDVPVVFQGGGGFIATFPIAAGDEALLIFSQRCIDAWFKYGGVQVQAETRMHDLSDGFAIIGPKSLPNAVSAISTTAAQLRSLDGETYVEVGPGKIQLVADEVVIHGRNKTVFDAGGTGFVYTPAQIDRYENGVTVVTHAPDPPEVPT
jgi:protein gp138